ncbi:MAG: hypothetical protein MUD01_28410 [Chloroflexaceae bacterium]|nr:hypothetical protein [Chloroflexaceae bacterium]
MQIAEVYSHFNAHEHILVHKQALWQEIEEVIRAVDAEACKTKATSQQRKEGQFLYSLEAFNEAFKQELFCRGWNEMRTSFAKDRIAIEIQFGKYAFVAYDLFVKHMAFYVGDMIDVGVEILPMKALSTQMSSGIGYYEGELYNVIRQGRGVPAVPLVLIGVIP